VRCHDLQQLHIYFASAAAAHAIYNAHELITHQYDIHAASRWKWPFNWWNLLALQPSAFIGSEVTERNEPYLMKIFIHHNNGRKISCALCVLFIANNTRNRRAKKSAENSRFGSKFNGGVKNIGTESAVSFKKMSGRQAECHLNIRRQRRTSESRYSKRATKHNFSRSHLVFSVRVRLSLIIIVCFL